MAEKEIKTPLANYLKNIKFDLQQNMIIGGPLPSLEYIVITRIAITLWQHKLRQVDLTLYAEGIPVFERVMSYESEVQALILPLITNPCKEKIKSAIKYVGEEIGKCFTYHFDFHEMPSVLFPLTIIIKKANNFLNYLCWSQQGTINFKKTALQLIDHSPLTLHEKFAVACNFCLEEKIQHLFSILEDEITSMYVKSYSLSMTGFWIMYIKEDYPALIREEGKKIFNYILVSAVCRRNEAVVQYIWENHTDESEKIMLIELLEKHASNSRNGSFDNILLYFFKHMNEFQLTQEGLSTNLMLFKKLNSFSRWNNSISVSDYILELIKVKEIDIALKIVTHCWYGKLLNLLQYKTIWQEFSLRSRVEQSFKEICDLYVDKILDKLDMETLKLLLPIGSSEARKELIESEDGMRWCMKSISLGGWKCFDILISQMMYENEICLFKRKYFENKKFDICSEMITKYKYVFLDEILTEMCEEEDAITFKRNLPHVNVRIMLSIFNSRCNLYDVLHPIISFLNWCFDKKKNQVEKCKKILFNIESEIFNDLRGAYFEYVNKLIKQRRWEDVDRYWRWIFDANNGKTISSEEKLTLMDKILHLSLGEPLPIYVRVTERSGLAKRFITSCIKPNEIDELREILKKSQILQELISGSLICGKNSEANKLLNWCFLSDKDQINKFKSEFMLTFIPYLFFNHVQNHYGAIRIRALFLWCNSSVETANLFKTQFEAYAEMNRKYLPFFSLSPYENLRSWMFFKENVTRCLEFEMIIVNMRSDAEEQKEKKKAEKETVNGDRKAESLYVMSVIDLNTREEDRMVRNN